MDRAWCAWAVGLCLGGWPAPAQVDVTPRQATLRPGQSCTFKAFLTGRPLPTAQGGRSALSPDGPDSPLWHWTLDDGGAGMLDPATGRFTAPETGQAGRLRVEARLVACPEIRGEAIVVLLPGIPAPLELVTAVLGQDWITPFSATLPFRSLPGNLRPRAEVREVIGLQVKAPVNAGYGLPFRVEWPLWPGAHGAMLSYWEAAERMQREVSGQSGQVLTLRGRPAGFQVETLCSERFGRERWCSQMLRLPVNLRGLTPQAGNPQAAGDCVDGIGLSARFQEPCGLARVRGGDDPNQECIATDPRSHVVRILDWKGGVRTLGGESGRPGHRDTREPSWGQRLVDRLCGSRRAEPEPMALFNRPTFVALVSQERGRHGPWVAHIADTGNHVIRSVHSGGRICTWAGTPGVAGYRDAEDPGQALFHQPMGLAKNLVTGGIYVADQGNAVIREILPGRGVLTRAGRPGEPGDQDGSLETARFSNLKGMYMDYRWSRTGTLFMLDGHALRALHNGEVTTFLGQVATPGFQEVRQSDRQERLRALAQPCLNDPWALCPSPRGFLITDRGNHAVREWDARKSTLTTVAGDPALGSTRWGLLRDGLGGLPLDESYATLERPAGIAPARFGAPGGYLVTTGTGVAFLGYHDQGRVQLDSVVLEGLGGGPGDSCQARFSVQASLGGRPVEWPIYYTVDFLEADGTLAERRQGAGRSGEELTAEGDFARPGPRTVLVRVVTDQGVSAGAQAQVP